MRIAILAIGRARGGPAMDLFADYVKRLPWPVQLRELEDRKSGGSASERKLREAALLHGAIPKGAIVIALDEQGKTPSSTEFAKLLGGLVDEGTADLCFLIGGADGLDSSLKTQARSLLSLGPMTWPHLLVRALLAEQLYRAHTILTGHPYHRA